MSLKWTTWSDTLAQDQFMKMEPSMAPPSDWRTKERNYPLTGSKFSIFQRSLTRLRK